MMGVGLAVGNVQVGAISSCHWQGLKVSVV